MTDSEGHSRGHATQESAPEAAPLRVTLTVDSRDAFLDMMELLNESEIAVRTDDITQSSLDGSGTVSLDLGKLTEKQRQTLEMALEAGYYEQPRKADLADLAGRIGVSKSAVSQRLRTAEAKLVKHAFGEFR